MKWGTNFTAQQHESKTPAVIVLTAVAAASWHAVLIHRYAAIPDGQKVVSSSSAMQEKRTQNLTPDQLAEAQSRAPEYIEKYGSGK